MPKTFSAFLRDSHAATSMEYAMIASLISIAIIAGASAIGKSINTLFFGPLASGMK